MDELMGHVLCSGAELQHRKNFRAGINGQPEPLHLRMAAQPRAQFVQLEVREPKMSRWDRSCKVCACSPARVNQVVMVACWEPKTREAAEGSSPSASADSTIATR